MRPRRDPLIRGQHLGRRQFPPHQRRVPGVLGPPLHPGVPGRGLPPLAGLVRGDVHHRLGDRVPQPARRQPPRPAQHQLLRRPRLRGIQRRGRVRDDLYLGLPQPPGQEQRHRVRQLDRQVMSPAHQVLRRTPRPGQHQPQLIGRELIPHPRHLRQLLHRAVRLGTPPDELRHRRMLPGTGVRLDPVPGGDHPVQLIIRGTRVPAVIPGRALGEERQRPAPGQRIQHPASREPGHPDRPLPGPRARLLVLLVGSGRLVIDRGGITPRLPVRRGHPVRRGNGIAGR